MIFTNFYRSLRVNSYQATMAKEQGITVFTPQYVVIPNLHGLAVQQDPENHTRIHSLAKQGGRLIWPEPPPLGAFFVSRNCSFVGTWCDGAKNDCLVTSTGGKECDGILWSFLHKFKV